jgi:transcriptional regulator with XRE-family HTH domain
LLNGALIREVRNSMGYTTKDIENLSLNEKYPTKISKSYLEELERGDKTNPSFKKLIVLAKVLNCKIDDFVQMS